MLQELLHFDPLTVVILIGGFIGTWATLKKDSRWHTSWIKRHEDECKEYKIEQNKIMARLVTLSESHEKRIDRIEKHEDQE